MGRVIIRIIFALVCIGLGYAFYPQFYSVKNPDVDLKLAGMTLGLALALFFIVLELLFARTFIQNVPIIMISLIFGFILSRLFLQALGLIPFIQDLAKANAFFDSALNLAVVFGFTYFAVMVILRTKDEWKFIIPYVEFRKTQRGIKPLILDTSSVIDGRIALLLATGALDNPVVIPSFVMQELQAVADSHDRLKRRRGRRGLDILDEIRKNTRIEVTLHEAQFRTLHNVDDKLLRLAKDLDGRIVTTDYNLIKVSAVQNVAVLNLNDVAESLKPVVLPGEEMTLQLVRAGEEAGQAVGYLDDGTMVVVDDARDLIGKDVDIFITSVHQSSAGKMFFGRVKGRERENDKKRN